MLTDRSRIETYQICPRLRLLRYHFGGRGLVPVLDNYYLGFGQLYHSALERFLRGETPALVISGLSAELEKLITAIAVRGLPSPQYAVEQRYLFEGLLWAYARTRLPEIQQQYRVISLEEELLWPIGEVAPGVPLVDMLRLDAYLEDIATESRYYKEYKTTAYVDEKWSMGFENNSQIMANLRAIEAVKRERPAGALIEGHFKGRRRRDTAKMSRYNGTEIQDSILCYAYEAGPGNISLEWKSRGVRVGTWELGFNPRRWTSEYLNAEDCRGLFVSLPPISPDPYVLDRWQRQTLAQETAIYRGLQELASTDNADAQREVMDRVFPLHETSCIRYGQKCSHYEICHTPAVRTEPLASPNFTTRVPHHNAERADAGA